MNNRLPKLSNRATVTPPSPIRKLAPLARAANNRGIDVHYLNIGQPDLKSPKEFFDGLSHYKEEVVAYDISEGSAHLRQAWSAYMKRTIDLSIDPEHMLITTGASEALIFAFMTCCDPGDEILIFDPTYANYIGFAAISGIELVPAMTSIDSDFALPKKEEIYYRISHRTKAILISHPNNPTGTVYTREELKLLLEIAEERNLFIISDETYRELIYDDQELLSILHLAPDNNRIVMIDSLSKRFSLCGARIGCIVTPNDDFRQKVLSIAQARLASPTIEQFACAYMLDHITDNYLESVKAEYKLRRDALYNRLNQIPNLTVSKPGGAFYCMAKLPVDCSESFAAFLLKEFSYNQKTLFVAPAGGFYINADRGRHSVRLAFVLEPEKLIEACEILERGLEVYKPSANHF